MAPPDHDRAQERARPVGGAKRQGLTCQVLCDSLLRVEEATGRPLGAVVSDRGSASLFLMRARSLATAHFGDRAFPLALEGYSD